MAVEVKHGSQYRREWRKGIAALLGTMKARSYVVYLGDRELEDEGTRVLPFESFVERLHAGEIVG